MQRPTSMRFTTDAPITSALSTSNISTGSTTTTTTSLNVYFSNVEEELNKKLDNEIDQFVDSFRDIVKSSGFRESIRVPGRDTDRVCCLVSFFLFLKGIFIYLYLYLYN